MNFLSGRIFYYDIEHSVVNDHLELVLYDCTVGEDGQLVQTETRGSLYRMKMWNKVEQQTARESYNYVCIVLHNLVNHFVSSS